MEASYNQKLLKVVRFAYECGVGVADIAYTMQVEIPTVNEWLNVDLTNERKTRGRKPFIYQLKKEQVQAIYRFYNGNTSIEKISKETNISPYIIRNVLGLNDKHKYAVVRYRHDGKTILKYVPTEINGLKTLRLHYANGQIRYNKNLLDSLFELDKSMKEDGKFFLENNDMSQLKKREREQYLAIKEFLSEEHQSISDDLISCSSFGKNKQVGRLMILLYTSYNYYVNLSSKEREQLDRYIDYYLRLEEQQKEENKNICYDYDFVVTDCRQGKFKIDQLFEHESIAQNFEYDILTDSFHLKENVGDVAITKNTFPYLKKNYELKRDKRWVERTMFQGYKRSPMVDPETVDYEELWDLIHWYTQYLKTGDNEFYKMIIKTNHLYVKNLSCLTQSVFETRCRRLKSVRELVENSQKKLTK